MVKGQKWLRYRCFCTQNGAFRDFYEEDRNLYEVDRSLYEMDHLYEADILFYNKCQLDYFFRFFLPMTIPIYYGPLRINYGPLRINDGPLRINYGPLRKNPEMRHFAYKNTYNEAIFTYNQKNENLC